MKLISRLLTCALSYCAFQCQAVESTSNVFPFSGYEGTPLSDQLWQVADSSLEDDMPEWLWMTSDLGEAFIVFPSDVDQYVTAPWGESLSSDRLLTKLWIRADVALEWSVELFGGEILFSGSQFDLQYRLNPEELGERGNTYIINSGSSLEVVGPYLGSIRTDGSIVHIGATVFTDTLVGPDADVKWVLDGSAGGFVFLSFEITFSEIENLFGGSKDDDLQVYSLSDRSHTLDLGSGSNNIEFYPTAEELGGSQQASLCTNSHETGGLTISLEQINDPMVQYSSLCNAGGLIGGVDSGVLQINSKLEPANEVSDPVKPRKRGGALDLSFYLMLLWNLIRCHARFQFLSQSAFKS